MGFLLTVTYISYIGCILCCVIAQGIYIRCFGFFKNIIWKMFDLFDCLAIFDARILANESH